MLRNKTLYFSETLSELKPINKFKWREDWTIIVDFSTDNSGYANIEHSSKQLTLSLDFDSCLGFTMLLIGRH